MVDTNGWSEHQKHIEFELKRGSEDRKEILDRLLIISNQQAATAVSVTDLRASILRNMNGIKDLTIIQNLQGKELSSLSTEIKIKAGLWGALGATIPSTVAIILMLLTK